MVFPRPVVDAMLCRINVDDEHQVHRIGYFLYRSVKKQTKARAAYRRTAKLLKASRERVDQPLEDMLRGLGIQDEVGAAIIGRLQDNGSENSRVRR